MLSNLEGRVAFIIMVGAPRAAASDGPAVLSIVS